MPFVVRCSLYEEIQSGRKNGRPVERLQKEFEIDVQDIAEGNELLDDLAGVLEEDFGKEVFECEE